MAKNKTIPSQASVTEFLDAITDTTKHKDCYALLDVMQKITGKPPVMWGNSIVGFGSYHYKYDTGREGDMPLTAFSPRKQNITIYIMTGFDAYEDLLQQLGPYKTGKSCLYIKRMADVNINILSEIIKSSYDIMDKKYNS